MPVIVYSQIKRKAEDAFASVIEERRSTHLSGLDIVLGLGGVKLPETTYIQVTCPKADPETFPGGQVTGNYHCEMEIGLVSFYTTDRDTRADQESELFDIMMREDIIDLLNQSGVSNFFAIGAEPGTTMNDWVPGQFETLPTMRGDFGEFMTGTLYCRPSRTI